MKGSERPIATRAPPQPPVQVEFGLSHGRWARAAQFSIVLIGIVTLGFALREMSAVAIPVMAALVTGLTLGPAADRLGRLGIPSFLIALGLVLALTLFLAVGF